MWEIIKYLGQNIIILNGRRKLAEQKTLSHFNEIMYLRVFEVANFEFGAIIYIEKG